MHGLNIVRDGIRQYFIDLIEQGKTEVEITETNAEIQKIINRVEETNGWIPVEECLPKDDRFILLSFVNFTDPMIGRYQKHKDGSGNFYIGDCDGEDTCLANDLIVNAWMELPKPYREEV